MNTAFFCFCCCCCLGTSPAGGGRREREVRPDPDSDPGRGGAWPGVLLPWSESSLSSEESLLADEEEPVFAFETSKAFSAEGGR